MAQPFCSKCGNPVHADQQYCLACGAVLERESPAIEATPEEPVPSVVLSPSQPPRRFKKRYVLYGLIAVIVLGVVIIVSPYSKNSHDTTTLPTAPLAEQTLHLGSTMLTNSSGGIKNLSSETFGALRVPSLNAIFKNNSYTTPEAFTYRQNLRDFVGVVKKDNYVYALRYQVNTSEGTEMAYNNSIAVWSNQLHFEKNNATSTGTYWEGYSRFYNETVGVDKDKEHALFMSVRAFPDSQYSTKIW